MEKLKVLELFGGIGACSKALENLNIDFEIVDYVEIDKYAVKSFNAIHNTNFEPQDIQKWDKDIQVDLIMHGSPCVDFSLAGKQAGGDKGSGTRSSLMYETIRIVEKLKPKYVVWENVKNILSAKHKHNFDNYLQSLSELGYINYYQILDAKDYGIPQHRERVFTISVLDNDRSFEFPPKRELKLKLKDLLENEVDEKYYLSNEQVDRIKYSSYHQKQSLIQKKEYYDTLCSRDWKDPKCIQTVLIKNCTKKGYLEAIDGDGCYINNIAKKRGTVQKEMIPTLKAGLDIGVVVKGNYSPSGHNATGIVDKNYIVPTVMENYGSVTAIEEELRIRKLTPKECWRLMGFNDEDFEKAKSTGNSNSQLYKQAGNSIVVNVLMNIFYNLLKDTKFYRKE